MQQAKRPLFQAGNMLTETLERVAVHTERLEEKFESLQILHVDTLLGKLDESLKKPVGVTVWRAILQFAHAIDREGFRGHSGQFAKQTDDLIEEIIGHFPRGLVKGSESSPFDKSLQPGSADLKYIRDARDSPTQGCQQLLLRSKTSPIEPQKITVGLPAFPTHRLLCPHGPGQRKYIGLVMVSAEWTLDHVRVTARLDRPQSSIGI
ncbi:hypothetical protein GCM10017557_38680 [Streptomyces aurantiacus]|uniref:Uncharacterized protein n=1 Tax=Streptomyces aurantiacus TaxID=47760 RepID=A0A7G1P1A2_9ACTN|nr:hypothetical protein GCM10017557_38680 [Streptomyces aurantiacus]